MQELFYSFCKKYTIVLKFISFYHQTSWRTAAVVDHDGWVFLKKFVNDLNEETTNMKVVVSKSNLYSVIV
jgi:hypothetical protein